jgi:deoxyadenosine/deoxycytidine kinase
VGKSSLARLLADRLHARLLLEPEDNPHLDAFYAGEPGAAFRAQMHFLFERYRQLTPLASAAASARPWEPVIADYIFEKDKIFAYINLSDAELSVYNPYYELLRASITPPDLVIYLQATPEVLRRRLERKNLASERHVSLEYLDEVAKAYDHFFFHYTQTDLLVINTSEIDFVERSSDLQELLRRLREPVAGTQFYLPLGDEGLE